MRKLHFEDWTVCGFYNCVPDMINSMEVGSELKGVTNEITATVPGSIYRDLERAGYIKNPFVDRNSISCEWVANRWWVYRSVFRHFKKIPGKRYYLVFEGLDYEGKIFLNNQEIGTHTGMFLRFEKDITELLNEDQDNQLCVKMKDAPQEHGQIGYTSEVKHMKSRFNYKWDFSARLVNIGICGDVYIAEYDMAKIVSADIQPVKAEDWHLDAQFTVSSEKQQTIVAQIELYDGDACVLTEEQTLSVNEGICTIAFYPVIHHPKLWYPNGHGESVIYQLVFSIKTDKVVDSSQYPVGFRTVEYRRTEGAGADALPYLPVINGKPIYIKGVNFVPLELLPGCSNKESYRNILVKIKRLNVNLLRVWGGGVIETEDFYDLCDELGLMVWQEFPMSSSGCDNVASKIPEFVEKLAAVAREAVTQKRNHVCLTFWSGGNELCDEKYIHLPDRNNYPADFTDSSIAMLRDIVTELNPEILMLPTSASGPLQFLDLDRARENHDVHGPWKYCGVKVHYEIYNRSDSMLHSEFGCDGMSCYESLEEFLSPENLVVTSTDDNLVWRHHGELWDTYNVREKVIFGEFASDELRSFIKCSQFLQAEGIRYAVEANRRRQFENCGSIIWQCNEPWPNVQCTTVMDYYRREKLSYYFLSDAFRELNPNMRYDALVYKPGETFRGELFISNDASAVVGTYTCRVIYNGNGQELFKGEAKAEENGTVSVAKVEFPVNADWNNSFMVEICFDSNGQKVVTEYLFLITDTANLHSRTAVSEHYDRRMEAYKKDPHFM